MLDEVEPVFAKNSMKHGVAIVWVRNSFDPKLDRCLNGHKEGKEEASVGECITESTHKKGKNGNNLRNHSSVDEFGEDHFCSPMSQSSVSEKEVGKPIQILHLYVCSCQHIRLLVIVYETHSDVCFLNGELVWLLADNRNDIAKFTLHRKLSNCLDNVLALEWRNWRSNANGAHVAQR